MPALRTLLVALAALPLSAGAEPSWHWREFPIEVGAFQVLARDSGPRNYYSVLTEADQTFIRGVYSPGLETVTLFAPVPDELRRGVRLFKFRWRAQVLPRGGNECVDGQGDGAANVYITWKRGLRWYSIKLDWSTDAAVGATCNVIRNPFLASDSVILRSGPPIGVWREEQVDLDALFRAHFASGDPSAEVPELQGIGVLTDGDQTHSASAADYAGFVFYKEERVSSPHARGSRRLEGAGRRGADRRDHRARDQCGALFRAAEAWGGNWARESFRPSGWERRGRAMTIWDRQTVRPFASSARCECQVAWKRIGSEGAESKS